MVASRSKSARERAVGRGDHRRRVREIRRAPLLVAGAPLELPELTLVALPGAPRSARERAGERRARHFDHERLRR